MVNLKVEIQLYYWTTNHYKYSKKDRNRERPKMHWNGFIWVAWQWSPSKKMKQSSLFLFFCLLMMALGECLLACEKKVESPDRVSKWQNFVLLFFVASDMMDILWKRRWHSNRGWAVSWEDLWKNFDEAAPLTASRKQLCLCSMRRWLQWAKLLNWWA